MQNIYVTGVFDLLHYGHLSLLANAKKLGDYLIVGVHSDPCVLNYKGQKPILSYEERIKTLKYISIIDKIIEQPALNPICVINDLPRPLTMVHGDDWLPPGWSICAKEKDVDIIQLPYTHNISTTNIINRIKKSR